jgi:hypothetical protein
MGVCQLGILRSTDLDNGWNPRKQFNTRQWLGRQGNRRHSLTPATQWVVRSLVHECAAPMRDWWTAQRPADSVEHRGSLLAAETASRRRGWARSSFIDPHAGLDRLHSPQRGVRVPPTALYSQSNDPKLNTGRTETLGRIYRNKWPTLIGYIATSAWRQWEDTHTWEDNIRMDRKEKAWDGVDWIHLAQDGKHWRGLCTHDNEL